MAFTPYHNIVGTDQVVVELLAPGDGASDLKLIMLSNIHASNDATVSLSIVKLSSSSSNNASETYYMLKKIAIPAEVSLLLKSSDIPNFDNSINGYSLFITVAAGDTVDVTLKK